MTLTLWSASASQALSDRASLTASVTLTVELPSTVGGLSSAPVTVTGCGVSQFARVKVNCGGVTVTSPAFALLTSKTTSDSGRAAKATVQLSVVPFSDTVADDLLRVTPGKSLSRLVTATIWSGSGSQALLDCASSTEIVTATTALPSTLGKLSLIPVTVTCCGVFQFAVVNVSCAGDTVTSAVLALLTFSTTFEAGWAVKTTVQESLVPFSETVAAVLLSEKPAVSLSWTVA